MNEPLKSDILSGLSAALPICLGYIPLGLTFGVLAQKAGLSPLDVAFMSFIVFAGGSQFIAVAMYSGGAAMMSIVFTTFMVNLRHFLMGSSLSVFLKGKNRWTLTLFAHTITDESFVVNSQQYTKKDWNMRRALVVNYAAYVSWFISTVTGALTGRFIPENALGMDYALTAMFIGLLVFQMKHAVHLVTAIAAGFIACAMASRFKGNGYIIVASVSAAVFGAMLNRMFERKENHDA